MGRLNYRAGLFRNSLLFVGICIFAFIASGTIVPDNTTIVGDLTVQSTDGIDVNPGSDVDTDLISIGVTGSPKIKWNETQDAIQFIEKLLLGTNAILSKTVNGSSYSSKMSLDTDTTTDSGGIDITRHGDSDASYGSISLLRSRGTHASPTIVQSGDLISSIVGLGYDGVDYEPAASIEIYSDQTPGSNDMPGRIDFKTVSDGSRTLTNVMRIGQRSDVMIGTTTSNLSAIFNVESTTKGSRPSPQMTTVQRDAIGTPVTGLSVYNTTLNTYDFYNGTSWLNLLDTSTFQEFSNKTVSGIFKFEESDGGSNYIGFQAPASVTSDVTFILPDGDGTSGQALKTDGAGTLSWGNASGGGGGINYIENPDAETDTTGYATYADAAGTNPVNGTGGSANITWTRTTSTPLRATGSFLLTKDAANRQGEGASYDFTIAEADKAKVLTIDFEYIIGSGTFVAGSSSTSSDVTVWIYDVTNSLLIQPSSFKLLSNSSTISDKFNATFQTASNSTSYRLIFHVGSTSASAYTIKIDDIEVGPSTYIFGTPVTDWTSYIPAFAQFGGASSTFKWRMVGSSLEVEGTTLLASAFPAGNMTFTLPPVGTPNPTGQGGGSAYFIGNASYYKNSTGQQWDGMCYITSLSSGAAITVAQGSGATALNWNGTNPVAAATGDGITYKISVPIVGWSSSVQMSDKADTRVVSTKVFKNGTQAFSVETKLTSMTVDNDRTGMWNSSSNRFDISVPGDYLLVTNTYAIPTTTAVQSPAYKINGGSSVYIGTSSGAASTMDRVPGTALLPNLKSGDYVELYIYTSAATTVQSGATSSYSLHRLSGPSAIAASESVNASYTTTAGQSIPNSTLTIIDFGTKDFDSHNAATTGASWKYTAVISGKYRVTSNLTTTSTGNFSAAEYIEARVYKNGSIHSAKIHSDFNGSTSNKSVQISTLVNLLAGDYIDVREYQTSGGSMPLETAAGYNWIDIERVGN